MSVAEVPARRKKGQDDGFHYVRVQKLPQTVLQGQSPMYHAKEQLMRFAGKEYEEVSALSDDVFTVYRCRTEDYEKVEAGLQKEANDRLVRPDKNLTSYIGAGPTEGIDEITQTVQKLDQVGASLPASND